MLFIFGAPRSGTTWLARIFDSHPDVLYRHEPDISQISTSIPFLCDESQIPQHREAARDYVERLARARYLRCAGSRPVFPKSYHNSFQHTVRVVEIYGLKFLGLVAPSATWIDRIAVPDFIDLKRHLPLTTVIKCVSLGRAGLLAEAVPSAKLVLLIRHPCGHVSSVLRGRKLGKLRARIPVSGLAKTPHARRRGLSAADLESMTPVEQLAWRWVILNELATEWHGDPDRVRLIRYEDLCERPAELTKQLFDFAGLTWHRQTASFIRDSTSASGHRRFFSTYRESIQAAQKWETEMSKEDQATTLRIARDSAPGRLYLS